MKFAITGSTGLVGGTLTRHLRAAGHTVTRVVRSYSGLPHGERGVVWHPDQGVVEAAGLEGHDVVVHLAAESLAGVWTQSKRRRIRSSRERGTTLLATTLAGLDAPPRVMLSASAVGFYGDRPDETELDESSEPGTGFLAELVKDWEASTEAASAAGIRVVHMRSGLVLSSAGGILPVLLPLFKLGLGAVLGSGRQYWPWIAVDEMPTAVLHVVEHEELAGAVNFVAPGQVTNEAFTHALSAAARRPAFLKVPAFAARMAPGGMADELLLNSARVVPRKLLDSGYRFRYPELSSALREMLGR